MTVLFSLISELYCRESNKYFERVGRMSAALATSTVLEKITEESPKLRPAVRPGALTGHTFQSAAARKE